MSISKQEKPPSSDAGESTVNDIGLIGLGSVFTAMIIAGFLVGYFFDSLLQTKPIFIIGCTAMGFFGGLMKLHKLVSNNDRDGYERSE